MDIISNNNKIYIAIVAVLFFILYAVFPTHNSTQDAWNYACSIKYGEELFQPHHLLYNVFGNGIIYLLHILNLHPDVLATMKVVNAAFAAGCLVWVGCLVPRNSVHAMCLCGVSFGMWRFATENEVYIIPIFISLAGTYYFKHYLITTSRLTLFLSAFLLALACLFHQIHFWWWLGVYAGGIVHQKNWKIHAIYLLTACIVPIVYFLVCYIQYEHYGLNPYLQFIFRDFVEDRASLGIGKDHILLTGINLIRSFIQVHGIIFLLIQQQVVWLIPGITGLALAGVGLYGILKHTKKAILPSKIMVRVYMTIFLLHLLFSILSFGNAEFMVMLPVFITCYLFEIFYMPTLSIFYTICGMCMWNFGYGICPQFKYKLDINMLTNSILDRHDKHYFILYNAEIIQTIEYYNTRKRLKNVYNLGNVQYGKFVVFGILDSLLTAKLPLIIDPCQIDKSFTRQRHLGGYCMDLENYPLIKEKLIDSTETLTSKKYFYSICY